MTTNTRILPESRGVISAAKWAQRRDIPIAILAWTALVVFVLWVLGHILRTVLILLLATLLAYALVPAVKWLQRFMPRAVAIVIVYVVVFIAVGLLLFFIAHTAIRQFASLAHNVSRLLTPAHPGETTPLEQILASFGITQDQIATFRSEILSQLSGAAGRALPFVTGIFSALLDTILVAVLSVYLLIDGERVTNWLLHNAPGSAHIAFVLHTLQRVVGGYIRGQLLLCTLVGVLVGAVTTLFGVPYALLLGVLAFFLAFIPIIGTFISGALCILLALTKGWLIAAAILVCFVIIHVIEGDLVGPRIVGKAVGLHPIISLAALIAGGELFGIWGALFASPIAGILQTAIITIWTQWRQAHPEEFKQAIEEASEVVP